MRVWVFGLCGAWLLAQPIPAAELIGDRAAGEAKTGQCRTCHGRDGYAKIPVAPHIGGEPVAYLSNQLTAFRDGSRVHEMMSVVAKTLSDQDIADLAAWYGAQQARATLRAEAADAPAACVACHGADGLSPAEDAPNLAGENAIYIDTQLKAFRSGKRRHEIMGGIAAGLDDQEIRALANWYAAITLEIAPPED